MQLIKYITQPVFGLTQMPDANNNFKPYLL